MPVRQQPKLETLQFDDSSSGAAASSARLPFRETEIMELKSLGPSVDHEGFSVPPSQSGPHTTTDHDSDSDDDVRRSRLRSIRIKDASEAAPVGADNVSVDFLSNNDIRRSTRDAWATPDGSAVSLKLGNTFDESDDWGSGGDSPKRVTRMIDVPLCERVVPPVVDPVMTNKIKGFLRADKLRIWLLPYSDERGDGHIPAELVAKYASRLSSDAERTGLCIERLRILTFNRKIRRLAEEGITVAHIQTLVVEPTVYPAAAAAAAADTGSAATAQASTKPGRKAYEEISIESPYALANAGVAEHYAAPVYAVANAVPTRRYEDLLSEYADIPHEQGDVPAVYAMPNAYRAKEEHAEPPTVPTSARPLLSNTADSKATAATVVEVPSPQHFAEPPLMQYNTFGNESLLSTGYIELAAANNDAQTAASVDQFALDLGPADALYTVGDTGYSYDQPTFGDFNDLGTFSMNSEPRAPMAAFEEPAPPPPASITLSVAEIPEPISMSFDPPPPPASSGSSLAPRPTPAARNHTMRASAMEVNLAAGGDATCEGFVPQLFRPKICSLCFRERSLHKDN